MRFHRIMDWKSQLESIGSYNSWPVFWCVIVTVTAVHVHDRDIRSSELYRPKYICISFPTNKVNAKSKYAESHLKKPA